MTLGTLFSTLKRYAKAVIATFVAVVVVIMIVTFIMPSKYTASAQLLATYKTADVSAQSLSTGASYMNSQVANYLQIAKSEKVLGPVASDLGLGKSGAGLSGEVTVTNPTGTQIINITVTDKGGQDAANIANGVAEHLAKYVSHMNDANKKDAKASPIELQTMQKATPPSSQSSPNIKVNFVLSLLLGVVAGIGVALVLEIRRTKFDSAEEVSQLLETPVLGVVPESPSFNNSEPVIVAHGESAISEEMRSMCSNIEFALKNKTEQEEAGRLLIVTSATPAEGKTTVSINIAAALAERGSRVLLIEADLRSPSVANRLKLATMTGLSDVLRQSVRLREGIVKYWKPNLHILPAGKIPNSPSILLGSSLMTELIDQARSHYDFVVVEATPMEVSSDAAIYATVADGVALVTRKGVSNSNDVKESADTLRSAKDNLLGIVFNGDMSKSIEEKNKYYLKTR